MHISKIYLLQHFPQQVAMLTQSVLYIDLVLLIPGEGCQQSMIGTQDAFFDQLLPQLVIVEVTLLAAAPKDEVTGCN